MKCAFLLIVLSANLVLSFKSSRFATFSSSNLVSSFKSYATINQDKLEWNENGYKSWTWKNTHKINYIDLGKGTDSENKHPLLLVHGFGASSYHWRYNIPILSKDYHVFAVDLLGFGLSDKPIIEYDATIWRDQILDFIKDVIFRETNSKVPCVVAGNSLGGFACLAASSHNSDQMDLIKGCILLNAAGRFKDDNAPVKKPNPEWVESLIAAFQRFVINLSFYYTKQPLRVEQILKQVYVDPKNVDDDLITSIIYPAQHPNAPEVFYRVVSRNGNGPAIYIDE